MPAAPVAAPSSRFVRTGLHDHVAAAVNAGSRGVVEDNIAGTGLKEPKPPRLRRGVRNKHAQYRVVKAIFGMALAITLKLGLKSRGVGEGQVLREDRRYRGGDRQSATGTGVDPGQLVRASN